MINITKDISLHPILSGDQEKLRNLMTVVYSPPYRHIWKDDCSFYLEKFYGVENFTKEISEPNTAYYFIHYQKEPIGNLRICFDTCFPDNPGVKASKLNRIYLDQSVHGKGIGKDLMRWTEHQCRQYGSEILWLEAMDSQEQALKFYKSMGFEISGSMSLDFDIMLPDYRGMKRLYKFL